MLLKGAPARSWGCLIREAHARPAAPLLDATVDLRQVAGQRAKSAKQAVHVGRVDGHATRGLGGEPLLEELVASVGRRLAVGACAAGPEGVGAIWRLQQRLRLAEVVVVEAPFFPHRLFGHVSVHGEAGVCAESGTRSDQNVIGAQQELRRAPRAAVIIAAELRL
eukprot:1407982-Prymnesium_polylepis.1